MRDSASSSTASRATKQKPSRPAARLRARTRGGNPRRTGAVEARTIVVVIALDNPDLIITVYERRT
jgi:hypothetical protein